MKRELALMTALLVGGAAAQSQAVLPAQPTDAPPPDAAAPSAADSAPAAATAADIPARPLTAPAPIAPAAMPAVKAPLADLLEAETPADKDTAQATKASVAAAAPAPTKAQALPSDTVRSAESDPQQPTDAKATNAPAPALADQETAAEPVAEPAPTQPAPAKESRFGLALPELPDIALPELPQLPAQQPAAAPVSQPAPDAKAAAQAPAKTPDIPPAAKAAPRPAKTAPTAPEAAPWKPAAPAQETAEFVAADGVLTQTTPAVEPASLPQAEQPQTVVVPAEHLPSIQTSAPVAAPQPVAENAKDPAAADLAATGADAGDQAAAQAWAPSAEAVAPETQPIAAPETLPAGWRYMKGQLSDPGLSTLPAGAKIQLAIEAVDRDTGLHSAHLVVGYGSDALPTGYYLNYNAGRLNTAQYDYIVKAKVFDASGEMLHMSHAYELPTEQAVLMDMDLGPSVI